MDKRLSHHADCRAANQWHPEFWDDPDKCNCDEAARREMAGFYQRDSLKRAAEVYRQRILSPENILIF